MTGTNELDRLLGEWLDDGPNRAPDRPLELALAHARAHPRGRDPFGFLRRDPMARPWVGAGPRPALVLATVGLLLVAVVAIGVGGSKPAIAPSPSTSPAASESAKPTPNASPTAPAAAGILVDLVVPAGEPQTVDIDDASGKLVEARSGIPAGEGGQTFPFDSIVVTNLDATTLQLGWAGFPCRTNHLLMIPTDPRNMVLIRPSCAGTTDSIGIDRILILRFSEAIDAKQVHPTLKPG
jgi:hypothetical protein